MPLRREPIRRSRGPGEATVEVHDQLGDQGADRNEHLRREHDQGEGETGERHKEPHAGGEEDAGPAEECPQDGADPDHVGSMRAVRATYLAREISLAAFPSAFQKEARATQPRAGRGR